MKVNTTWFQYLKVIIFVNRILEYTKHYLPNLIFVSWHVLDVENFLSLLVLLLLLTLTELSRELTKISVGCVLGNTLLCISSFLSNKDENILYLLSLSLVLPLIHCFLFQFIDQFQFHIGVFHIKIHIFSLHFLIKIFTKASGHANTGELPSYERYRICFQASQLEVNLIFYNSYQYILILPIRYYYFYDSDRPKWVLLLIPKPDHLTLKEL